MPTGLPGKLTTVAPLHPTPPPASPCPVCSRAAPWEYVLGAGIGAYVGNKIPQWEAGLLEDINEMRADRNMPPLTRAGGMEFGARNASSESN